MIHKGKKIQQDATMYQNFIIRYLYKAQHVSGDTPPIIRSLKHHWQPIVFHTWKVVGRAVGGCCQAHTQHVSGDTPPIIKSLKLHWQPLVFHTWKVVGRAVGGLCQTLCLTTSKQPSTYEKSEVASAVLGS
jgi:hypothetical protein